VAHVQLTGIRKSYDGGTRVVDGIDLEVRDGEFVVLVGPSGCGKSTLLRMVAGLESISEGNLQIDGVRVNEVPPRHRDIAMVFQDYALYPHKTLFDNMAFGLRLRGESEAEVQRRVNDAAALLQISHLLDRKPAALSGGQRQRVAIGRAIVRQPKLFLFDEPLSNLDAQLRGDMRAEIKKLHRRLGATILYVTHDQVEAMTLADRIVLLRAGKAEQIGTPDDLYRRPASAFVAGFMGSPPMNLLPAVLHAGSVQLGTQTLARHALPQTLQTLAADQPLRLGIRPESLHLQPAAPDALALHGTVSLVEPLGAETLVRVQLPGVDGPDLTARFPAGFTAPSGARVTLYVSADDLHFFDSATGLALASTGSQSAPHP
jgi:multiple sugar transport system ATP-binding protein